MAQNIGIWVTVVFALGYAVGALFPLKEIIEGKREDDDEVDAETPSEWSDEEECKMVLVVRTDLKMKRGKACAQCAHAALACYQSGMRSCPDLVKRWERTGCAKIALQTETEEDLEVLRAVALSLNVTARQIHDAGRTQIAAGSATVLGLGPAPKSVIDNITGSLKLY